MPSDGLSFPWAQRQPPTAAAAAAELDGLEEACTPTQRRSRTQAFPKARRYIMSNAGQGVEAPVSKTFQDRGRPTSAHDARVDIEVIYGRAFV